MFLGKVLPGIRRGCPYISVLLCLVLVMLAGCAGAPGATAPPATTEVSLPRDRVTVTYFYSPRTSAAIHLATEWIITTIEDGYADAVAQDELALVGVDADQPSGQAVMAEYGASLPSLFITTTRDGIDSTVEVKAIWLYLDDSLEDAALKEQFIGTLRREIDRALGLSPATTPPPSVTTGGALASVEVRVMPSSWTDYLELVVYPEGENGQGLSVSGTLSVKLWDRPSFFEDKKGELLQEWDGVPVAESDFYESIGIMLNLPYHDFRPHSASIGYVQATLTVDGQVVSSIETPVQVRRALGCCEEE